EKRIIITQDNDFKNWIKPNKAGVFIIPSYLSNQEIDDLLSLRTVIPAKAGDPHEMDSTPVVNPAE
ncbi:hypothetical protein KKE68_02970, partial [Patescibacteria group bacterium]|nr:hypothetical protein [Patescibacteria group bacterium]